MVYGTGLENRRWETIREFESHRFRHLKKQKIISQTPECVSMGGPMSNNLYETDFYAWANEQAALLRSGKLSLADIGNIAEEIESMGKAEQRELESRLSVLILHLLKWRFQPMRRGASWEATIRVQRRELTRHIERSPSLKPKIAEATSYAYENAKIEASAETGFAEATFPASCPWTYGQIMDAAFWPHQD